MLQRIGDLDSAPTVSQGPNGLEVIAIFQNVGSARDAVQTLHRFDLRSEAEKKAVNHQAPKENERFYVQVVEAPAAPAVPAVSAGAPAAAPAEPQGPKLRIKANGVHVWPLPSNWSDQDVMMIAGPYGQVARIQMENLSSGQKGALIDYAKDAFAKAALAGLNGLSLMGLSLRCVMQEEPEPVKPILRFAIYMDELPMPSRPEVDPRLDDCEVFLDVPRASRSESAAREWLANFGSGVDEVHLMKDIAGVSTGKAYVRFKSHPEALKALTALQKAAPGSGGSQQAAWSESERTLRGTRGPYGLDVLRRIVGDKGIRLQEICQAVGLTSLALAGGHAKSSDSDAAGHSQVHFVARCEEQDKADKCKAVLATELAKIHELFSREVRGSIVLRGFPASWSEKGLKFVFAPFGGMAGAVLEEAGQAAGEANAAERLAYVKLKTAAAAEKALSNLNKTKVGDGDLVEECVVSCHRWHLQAWSDASCRATFFIDQLAMNRRPLEAAPGPEDRELFVKNLPLQDMNRQQLQEYFEGFGEVEELYLIKDIFTGDLTGEGYVRFKLHDNALRCIDALTPEDQAEESKELTGWWSESERVLQRKANCYRFNLISEIVGADGSGLERLKSESHIKGLWLLAESLTLKDRHAPPRSARQLHFVAKCAEEGQAVHFRELLERTLEDIHGKIGDRIDKRKRKAEQVAAANNKENAVQKDAASLFNAVNAETAAGGTAPPAAGAPPQAPWSGGPPGGQWPAGYWGQGAPPPGAPPWFPGQAPPPGYPGGPPPAGQGPWTQQTPPAAGVSVFEQGRPAKDKERRGDGEERKKSRSRRRRRGEREAAGGAEGEEPAKEKKHRSGGEHKRRRRRATSGSPAKGEADA